MFTEKVSVTTTPHAVSFCRKPKTLPAARLSLYLDTDGGVLKEWRNDPKPVIRERCEVQIVRLSSLIPTKPVPRNGRPTWCLCQSREGTLLHQFFAQPSQAPQGTPGIELGHLRRQPPDWLPSLVL